MVMEMAGEGSGGSMESGNETEGVGRVTKVGGCRG